MFPIVAPALRGIVDRNDTYEHELRIRCKSHMLFLIVYVLKYAWVVSFSSDEFCIMTVRIGRHAMKFGPISEAAYYFHIR